MRMAPAYRMMYDVQARGPKGLVTKSRIRGTVTGDGYELVGLEEEDSPEVVARLAVTSWQPYENDALPDALRTARDLCNVLSVAFGNQLAFEPVTPPAVEKLDGGKGQLPAAGGASIRIDSFGIHIASAERYPDPRRQGDPPRPCPSRGSRHVAPRDAGERRGRGRRTTSASTSGRLARSWAPSPRC